jgi:autotransporter-associated beta strand protein
VAAGNFVVATFGTSGGNNFRDNAPLIIGPQAYGSPSFTGSPFGAAATDKPALTIEAGGFWSVSDGGNGRGHSIFSLAGGGTVLNNTSGTGAHTDTLTLDGGAKTDVAEFSGTIRDVDLTTFPTADPNLVFALTKTGSTTQILSGTNSYTGATTVNGGTLIINGNQAAATGPVTVASGATLAGTGIIGGAVTINPGANLLTSESPGVLTMNSNLNLSGTVKLAVARNGAVLMNDLLVVVGTNTYGGTLVLTNISSTPLQPGDSFQLFAAGKYAGVFTNLIFPAGYTFGTNSLVTNGTVTVLTGLPNTPPTLADVGDANLSPGQWLIVTNNATDLESPPQVLTFSLLNPPTNAVIDPNSGVLSWRVPVSAAGGIQTFTVVVSDNGSPSLSATNSFIAFIGSVIAPEISQPTWSANAFSMTVSGGLGPDYTVQASTNLTIWADLFTTNPVTIPFTWSDSSSSNFAVRFYRVQLTP